jgi:sulfite reductase (ferredoxin)
LLRYVRENALLPLYLQLKQLQLTEPGFDSTADITSCPGTDTCNLGISNSTSVSKELESVIYNEYPELIYNHDIKIKISGCMNSCGQHALAQIGFHGSSFKVGAHVVPALQVLLGGGTIGNGFGRAADKVIKVASKRAPDVLRTILDDYKLNALENEKFNDYYLRNGENYFYQLLKDLGNNNDLKDDEYLDWGSTEKFKTAIGTGECASVIIDLVATLLYEAEEKLEWSAESFDDGKWGDAIYHSYSAIISVAKSLLLDKQVHTNTHKGIIDDFDTHFINSGEIELDSSFKELALQINQCEPSKEFSEEYFDRAKNFFIRAKAYRQQEAKLVTA